MFPSSHPSLNLVSIIGGVVIAVGLYSVVWGKGKDYINSTTTEEANGVKDGAQKLELPITAKVDTPQVNSSKCLPK